MPVILQAFFYGIRGTPLPPKLWRDKPQNFTKKKNYAKKISKGGEGGGGWVRDVVFDSFPLEQAVRIVKTKRLRITPQDGS